MIEQNMLAASNLDPIRVIQRNLNRCIRFHLETNVGKRVIIAQRVKWFAAFDPSFAPRLYISILPNTGDQHPRVPVPPISNGGLNTLIRLITAIKSDFRILGMRMDTNNHF